MRYTTQTKHNTSMAGKTNHLGWVCVALAVSLGGCIDDTSEVVSLPLDAGASADDTSTAIKPGPVVATDAGASRAADVAAVVDAAAPQNKALHAFVFKRDPVSDEYNLTEVKLKKPATGDGTLISDIVEVRNCLNIDGGKPLTIYGGTTAGSMCVEKQTVKPGHYGDYLYVKPPDDFSDPNDGFSELMSVRDG